MGALFVAAWRRPGRTLWRAIAIAGALLVIVTVATGRHRVESIPMTVVAAVVALIGFHRSRLPANHTLRRRGWFVAALRWLVAVTVALSIVIDAAFIAIFDPLSNAPYRELFAGEESEDFSRLAWPEAFEHLHAHLSHAYAMGEWKRIDWRSLQPDDGAEGRRGRGGPRHRAS
jgi:hypothetical protein